MQAPAPPDPTSRRDSATDPPTPTRGELLLLGSSVRAAAQSAAIAGWAPVAVDLFGDRETLSVASRWHSVSHFQTAIMQRGLDSLVDASTPLALVGGLLQGWDWLAALPPSRFLNSQPEQFPQSSCPRFLADLAVQAGVNFPPTEPSPDSLMPESGDGWLIKRRSTSGGLGVAFCTTSRQQGSPQTQMTLPAAEQRLTSESDSDCYLQQIVPGRPLGASFMSDGRSARLVGVCRSLRKRLGNLPFVYAGALGPIPVDKTVTRQLSRIGDALIDQTGARGPFNIDVILNGADVTLLEVNPRYSGSMELIERSRSDVEDRPRSLFEPPENWTEIPPMTRHGSVSYIKRILFTRKVVTLDPNNLPGLPQGLHWTDTPARPTEVLCGQPAATLIGRLDRISLRDVFRVSL